MSETTGPSPNASSAPIAWRAKSIPRRTLALAHFSRPHTVIATTVQVCALYQIAGGSGSTTVGLGALSVACAASLLLNLFVVGLNQLTDVQIDRINKPSLPLPAGLLDCGTARRIVVASLAGALILAALGGPILLASVALIAGIGTVYSVPPLRLKAHAIPAALCIATARGVVANVGILLYFGHVFAARTPPNPTFTAAIAAFFFTFTLVIALYKDIPDVVGDQFHAINTLAVKWGPRRVFELGRVLLTANYLGLMAWAGPRLAGTEGQLFLIAQALCLAAFWRVSLGVDPLDRKAFASFYLFVWGLFYAEYALLSWGARYLVGG